MKDLNGLVVDSTATVYFKTEKDAKPDQDKINQALGTIGSKIDDLKLVTRPKPAAAYELVLKGVG